LSYAEQSVV